ncbi:HAUS augmin-like complex subunit 4 [Halteromyces radiatus]|uniref:HAUS augmin-like complex subunit 4 n=1 Tax=Halteromyces radiatus TaxID=101107 RepID=UPI002220FD7C|nr:HAUS augmin-like complex subunit 4 [Halteromyces radiatus]KAI8089512.1 HAUS augmin-like complex subunit 4 [Halteromyces radiatus]
MITKQVDQVIQGRYRQVVQLVAQYQPDIQQQGMLIERSNAQLVVSSVDQLYTKLQDASIDLIHKKISLSNEITRYVKVILELLDVLWMIIQEFKYTFEKEKNLTLDAYLGIMADAVLLRRKKLHLSILTATYDDQLVASLHSLRTMLDERTNEANKDLSKANDQLQKYHHLGPMFEKLRKTYCDVLKHIRSTEDDILRMKTR